MHPTTLPGRSYVRIGTDRVSRLLFNWRARDGSINPVTSETPSFVRATAGGAVVDRNGVLRVPVHSQPRFVAVDLDGDLTRESLALAIDDLCTNLVLQSENFGTTWAASGTPTRSAAAIPKAVCGIALDLLGDDDGAAQEGYTQTVTFTGDAVKAVSIVLAKGTSAAAGGSDIILRDTSASADRLKANVVFNASGVPTVTMTTGQQLASPELLLVAGSVRIYRFRFQTSSVTAANTNSLRVFPASVVAEQGNVYAGGVQAENSAVCTDYKATTTGSVTTNADALTVPLTLAGSLNANNDDFTIYARLARPFYADATGTFGVNFGICSVGAGTAPRFGLAFQSAARNIAATIDTASTDAEATAAIPSGSSIQVVAQFADLFVGGKTRLDVGAGLGAYSSPATAITALGAQSLRIGCFDNFLTGALLDLKIAQGLLTYAQMQEAF